MNEFTKKTGPVSGGSINLPLDQSKVAYEIKVLFTAQGIVAGVIGPNNMPLTVVVNHLAAGISAVTVEMISRDQQKESRIVLPKIVGMKPI